MEVYSTGSGGTAGDYTYLWMMDGQTTTTATNLAPGLYGYNN